MSPWLVVGLALARAADGSSATVCQQKAAQASLAYADATQREREHQRALAICMMLNEGSPRASSPRATQPAGPLERLPETPQIVSLSAPPCPPGQTCLPGPQLDLWVLSGERWRYGAAVLLPGAPEAAAICAEVQALLADAGPSDLLIAVGAASEEGTRDCEAWRACVRGTVASNVALELGASSADALRVWTLARHRTSDPPPACSTGASPERGACTAFERPRMFISVRGRGEASDAQILREYWRRCDVAEPPLGCLERANYPDAEPSTVPVGHDCGVEPETCKKPRQPPISAQSLCGAR